MNSCTEQAGGIEYLKSLLSPNAPAEGLNLTIPQEVLTTAREVSANNFLIYIGQHEAKEKLLNVCLHAYLLGYLGQINGFRHDILYWPVILQNNGFNPEEKIDHLDFCLGSCFMAGEEAGDPAFYEERRQKEAESLNELYEKARVLVNKSEKASIPFLQRNLGIGYSSARNIRDLLILNNEIFKEKPAPEVQQRDEDALVEENYGKARRLIIQSQKASTSFVQRKLGVGYLMASRVMDRLEVNGVIGPVNGANPREVLLKPEVVANVYLDIDGVLLANENNLALHAKEFLFYVLEKYPDTTYWLTTHCQGDSETPIEHVGHLFDSETVELMRNIKPTRWTTAKTEAIDFSEPFLWFDDDCFPDERAVLNSYGVFDNWIEVNLAKNNAQLGDFLDSFPIPTK